ncbi:glycoside hydrolase family 20 zincin-like fold domain-containing protein [Marinilabiliaceae bacterium ANBcel2]|nr:glycoside hydrolase family 20 zincin-like fold domain-containing protein [Marinilabiliaceae bacterium ANBcel2]
MKKIFIVTFVLFVTTFNAVQICGNNNDSVKLIPSPISIEHSDGFFCFENGASVWINSKTSENLFAYEQLKEEIEKGMDVFVELENRARRASIHLVVVDDVSDNLGRFVSIPDSDKLQVIGEQGYYLDLTDDKITITAQTSQGLFYGVQTLRQIVRGNSEGKSVPSLTILDYPAMEYRGWMDDISRGPIPSIDYLKKVISKMAHYKQNYFNLYTEHTLRFDSYPDIAPADGLTVEEIKKLEEYAQKYHVDLIGNQQAFGHMEKILRIPFYHDIDDNGWNINPGTEKSYQFLEDILGESALAYSHPFFNINCDETEELGSGKASDYVDSLGMETVYAKHINRLNDILKEYDKRVMMWGDIAVNNPDIIDMLPRDLIILSWGYHPGESFDDAITPFADSGFDFMVAPGVSCWSQIYPDLQSAVINIANYVRDGNRHDAMGMMNTAWDDDGENLFNYNWHGLIWGAECSWNPIVEIDPELARKELGSRLKYFNNTLDLLFFETSPKSVSKTLMEFNKLRQINVPSPLHSDSFWGSFFDFYPDSEIESIKKASKEFLKVSLNLSSNLNSYQSSVSEHSRIVVETAEFAARRAAFAAKKNLAVIKIQNAYDSGCIDKIDKVLELRDQLVEELHTIKQDYVHYWMAENRAHHLETNLAKYDMMANELLNLENYVFIELIERTKEGAFLVELSTLLNDRDIIFTVDGSDPAGFTGQMYNEPFEIDKPVYINAMVNKPSTPLSSEFILAHKALGVKPDVRAQVSSARPAYRGGGSGGLTDGLKGSDRFDDGRWQGYAGQDVDVRLDLEQEIDISRISVDFIQSIRAWIFMPSAVEFYISKDGDSYEKIAVAKTDTDPQEGAAVIETFSTPFNLQVTARYLKIVARNPGSIPAWHNASGNASFMFLDEIIVE